MKIPGLALILLASLLATVTATEKPNIIIFLVDDMGLMDTSVPMLADAKGQPERHPLNDWYRTPNMEKLAAQGIRFSNFYAHNTCSPSRVSILTGQNSARHGTTCWINPHDNNKGTYGPPGWNWTGLKKESVTLPRLLQAAGYKTIHVGKAHFGPKGSEGEDPRNLGFDVNIAGAAMGQPGSYYGSSNYIRAGNEANALPGLEKFHGTDTFLTEALTLEANDQIARAVEEKKPFFLHLAHYAAHGPFEADPRFHSRYKNSGKGEKAEAFATLIEGMDKSLGDVMAKVSALGQAENTLLVFLGDNGSDAPLGDTFGHASSSPLKAMKGTSYEGGTRAPFVAAWLKPDPTNPWQKKLPVAPGAVQPQIGTVMDLYPTLLALTDTPDAPGHRIDGFDLKPQLDGGRNPARAETFLSHVPHVHRSSYFSNLVSGDWKVVYHYFINEDSGIPSRPAGAVGAAAKGKRGAASAVRYELYDLKNDPFETTNLADKNPGKLQAMMKELVGDLEAKGALYPVRDGQELRPQLP